MGSLLGAISKPFFLQKMPVNRLLPLPPSTSQITLIVQKYHYTIYLLIKGKAQSAEE